MKKTITVLTLIILLASCSLAIGCEEKVPTVDYGGENAYEYTVLDEEYLTYIPDGVTVRYGLLFYVGTAIPAEEYDYLFSALASQGYLVVANKNPFSYIMYEEEEPTFSRYPDVKFFVGGHSQGGGATLKRTKENFDIVQGMIMLAPLAYDEDSLADTEMPALLIEAVSDGVLNASMKAESKRSLPKNHVHRLIEGAHMSFSSYDDDFVLKLFKDGPATQECKDAQKQLTVEYILQFLKDTISGIKGE